MPQQTPLPASRPREKDRNCRSESRSSEVPRAHEAKPRSTPKCRPRSLRQPGFIVIEEILAAGGSGARRGLGGGGMRYLFQDRPLFLLRRPFAQSHEPRNGLTVAREHDVVARFGAPNQLGQLALGIANGNLHVNLPCVRRIWTIGGLLSDLGSVVTI